MFLDIPAKEAPIQETLNIILHDADFAKKNQQAVYAQDDNVFSNIGTLYEAPALTSRNEIDALRNDLSQVIQKKKIIIQAGLCVEDMDRLKHDAVALKEYAVNFSDMLQGLAMTAEQESKLSVVRLGRVAGQLAKPRSDTHEKDGTPVYRGPMFNGVDKNDREAKGKRLAEAYNFSSDVLYRLDRIQGKKLYASHEALALGYEESLRQIDHAGSAPFLWIGNRTRQIDGPHIRFASEITNPIGLKCDGKMKPEELEALITTINPSATPGKLTLIFRMGAKNIDTELSPLLDVVAKHKESLVVISDPMHGNTEVDPVTGNKTRRVENIISEATSFAKQCTAKGIHPGGIHLEVSPEAVTECLGAGVDDLRANYQTLVDPCLNPSQAKTVVKAFVATYNA
jgi:3-deoxy-7-phosphoheptulonate synthase